MKEFIKKIYDFFASRVRQFQRERCPRGYVRVSAETLMDICECINPSYDRLIKYAERELEGHYGWGSGTDIGGFFKKRDPVNAFYDDREKFLDKGFLASFLKFPDSFHEYLIEKYSPAKEMERFQSKVAAAGLQKHILLSNAGEHKAIDFEKIMVEDDVELNLGGKFCQWKFHCVKFCGTVNLNIYPPSFNAYIGGMIFSESVCFGTFSCLFAGVPRFNICNSKFMSSMTMDIGTDAQLAAYGRVEHMTEKLYQWLGVPSLKFVSNSFKRRLSIYCNSNSYKGHLRFPSLGEIHFSEGNYISALRLIASLYPKTKPEIDGKPIDYTVKMVVYVYEITFDNQERIKMPPTRDMMLHHKDFFIALKNQAIEKRDREAEFNYGRKERYFDRGLATRWQDKFVLGWSHYVSDSGISWIRPAVILLVGQWILAYAFIGWYGGCGDFYIWTQVAIESLSPLSNLPEIIKSGCQSWANTLSASVYIAVRRVFSLVLYYEVIKALRRFAK